MHWYTAAAASITHARVFASRWRQPGKHSARGRRGEEFPGEPLTLQRRRSVLSNRGDQSGNETDISRHALTTRLVDWIHGGSSAGAEQIAGDPVQLWKAAWRLGAEARWNTVPLSANPYRCHRSSRHAKAWRAGWQWAEQQPDRRKAARVQLAHPHRRSADGQSALRALVWSARSVSVGVSTVVVAAWLWQTRRKRRHHPLDAAPESTRHGCGYPTVRP